MEPIVSELTDWKDVRGSKIGYLRIFDVYLESKIFRCILREGRKYEDDVTKRSDYWIVEIYSKDPSRFIRDFEFEAAQAQPFVERFGIGNHL